MGRVVTRHPRRPRTTHPTSKKVFQARIIVVLIIFAYNMVPTNTVLRVTRGENTTSGTIVKTKHF